MNVCTLLILFWQSYKYGSKEKERERKSALKYSPIFLICFVCGIFKTLIPSFHPLGWMTMEHVNLWKNAQFLKFSSADYIKNRYEEAKIRFKDNFNNRLYFRSIIYIIYKNNALKVLVILFLTICVSVVLFQGSLLIFFFNSVHLVLMVWLFFSHQ